ncbi:MAG: LPS-assembly protein LptD [Rhodospirillales bacterium]
MTRRLRLALATATAACALLTAAYGPARAQETPGEGREPAVINADQLTFDDGLGLVIATGNVELSQGGRLLIADTVTYNQKTNVATASGNVRMVEPNGDIVFAEYVELTDDLRRGFVDRVRILLTDNSRVAGASAERTDGGRFMRINRAVYSPCNLCPDDPTRAPVWQIRSARITHDQEAKDIVHRDAQLEILGVPILYTPFLSHPDPTVERRSGFLAPTLGTDSNLGSIARSHYYFDIAPQTDATLETTWSERDGLLLGGELRQRFESGAVTLEGSVVRAERKETENGREITKDTSLRYHLFGTGVYNLNDVWRTGFSVNRTSDNTYLRRYGYSYEDILTSRLYTEGFWGRSYAAFNAYGFQDLRAANAEEEPTILPEAYLSWLGQPGDILGGRASFEGGIVSLSRAKGSDYRRISLVPGWERTWYASSGLVTTVSTLARGDFFFTEQQSDLLRAGATGRDEDAARLLPVGQISLRYPLVGQIGSVQPVVEPIVSFTAAPRIGDVRSSNEDSRINEITDRNLFRYNRFTGVDRVETGQRVTYGVQAGLYGERGGYTGVFLGQSYGFDENDDFGRPTGVNEQRSDYVGRLTVRPGSNVSLEYAASLDGDTQAMRRQELFASAGVEAFTLNTTYLYRTEPSANVGNALRDEYLVAGFSSRLTDNWSIGASRAFDFSSGGRGVLSTSGVLTYADECLVLQFVALDSNIQRSDLSAGPSFFVRFVFRGLGEITSPRVGSSSLGLGGTNAQTTR